MKTITMYEADDGSRWDDPAKAKERDALIVVVAEAMAPLGARYSAPGCDYENGHGYVQHAPAVVAEVRRRLLALSRRRKHVAEWIDDQARKGADLMTAHVSWICRIIDEYGPLMDAWSRLGRIDKQGREWGQIYYADHPDKAEAFPIEDRTEGAIPEGADRAV